MQFNTLDQGTYTEMRNTVLKILENPFLARDQNTALYGNIYDVCGNPTVGYGYDLTQHADSAIRTTFLKAFGLSSDADDSAIQAASPVLAEGLERIAGFKSGSLSAADLCEWRPETPLLDDAHATALLSQILDQSYEGLLDSALRRRCPGVTVPASRERVALCSLVFNGGPGLIGPGLGAALAGKNRAEAWWQIRWNSNASGNFGLAVRRAYEGTLFGLYIDPATVSRPEAVQVEQMDKAHDSALRSLNSRFAKAPSDADANYKELLGYLPETKVPTLDEALAPAKAMTG